ncbi:nucleotidyl transferase AbiEii/AbiGii toxin family protein [Dactylosporangium sp. NBC_01737]|uniref:nucleotidyl transferase AbiEii/AbiGii toxin family protein n=1 Tax=Dactylosporangium sp. NBC_01737 TaxID=2975959 RepID=UPI002E12E717|nr:nucleotidyl transferase AbiEii/AbiGii toxin family protein [Dactylosporangium sp. NBC_01737]
MHGNFEIHLTALASQHREVATMAARDGLKFSDIVLDRGYHPGQPMITFRANGTWEDVTEEALEERIRLRDAGIHLVRVKIEADPDNPGVPATDAEAIEEPDERYFEHHLKLRLPDVAPDRLASITALVVPHNARLSRNARRRDTDGEQRFVTQRCHRVGRTTALSQLAALREALTAAGHDIVEVEEEYVVSDTALHLDSGWLTDGTAMQMPPARQDPWVKGVQRNDKGEVPVFADAAQAARWHEARRQAMYALLHQIATSRWSDRLVLCGSIALRAQLGDATREPADIDLVALLHTLKPWAGDAQALQDGLAQLGPDPSRVDAWLQWGYGNAPGMRLRYPVTVDDAPDAAVMVDVILGDELPVAPELLDVAPGVLMLATPPALALASKLCWLESDANPQAKDLYDAVLLAEHTTVEPAIVRELLRREIGDDADAFGPYAVERWTVDWNDLRLAQPHIAGDLDAWKQRLITALWRSFSGDLPAING